MIVDVDVVDVVVVDVVDVAVVDVDGVDVVAAAAVTFLDFAAAQDCAIVDKCRGRQSGSETSPSAPVAADSSEDLAKYLCCFPVPHPYTCEET